MKLNKLIRHMFKTQKIHVVNSNEETIVKGVLNDVGIILDSLFEEKVSGIYTEKDGTIVIMLYSFITEAGVIEAVHAYLNTVGGSGISEYINLTAKQMCNTLYGRLVSDK